MDGLTFLSFNPSSMHSPMRRLYRYRTLSVFPCPTLTGSAPYTTDCLAKGTSRSICDALLMAEPGELTFAINKDLLAGGLVVSDSDVRHAVAYAWRDMKLVVEPGGAVALAALLSGAFEAKGRSVAVVLSGGNVDPHLFADIICNIKELATSSQ